MLSGEPRQGLKQISDMIWHSGRRVGVGAKVNRDEQLEVIVEVQEKDGDFSQWARVVTAEIVTSGQLLGIRKTAQ